MFSRAQLGPPTPGRHSDRIYRQIQLDESRHNGIIRYDPALVDAVDEVDDYVIAWLDRQALLLGDHVVRGMLYSPVDVPLP